jgi:MoxR-like ATPase
MSQDPHSFLQTAFRLLDVAQTVTLERRDGVPEQVHCFDDPGDRARLALKAALAAGRPLLVRGEPGVGKTQLAAAAAQALKRPLISFVVDARCEARDVLWHFDTVRRLAEAQICGVLKYDQAQVRERLQVSRFIEPGPLWWGFDWNSAKTHCEMFEMGVYPFPEQADPANGRVVLIDEIDKADSDLPNGLLEALGSGRFQPEGCEAVVMGNPAPLVIITTNEERVLPDAFVRRCLVLHLKLPEDDKELKVLLITRAMLHFPKADPGVLTAAADLLIQDRRSSAVPKPGQAEYFDLLRAVLAFGGDAERQKSLLNDVAEFTFKKQSGAG